MGRNTYIQKIRMEFVMPPLNLIICRSLPNDSNTEGILVLILPMEVAFYNNKRFGLNFNPPKWGFSKFNFRQTPRTLYKIFMCKRNLHISAFVFLYTFFLMKIGCYLIRPLRFWFLELTYRLMTLQRWTSMSVCYDINPLPRRISKSVKVQWCNHVWNPLNMLQ